MRISDWSSDVCSSDLVLAALAALVVWFLRRRSKPAEGPLQPDDVVGTADLVSTDALRTLQNGDVIEYLGHKWFVRGRLDFNEDGYVWTEHLLDDAEERSEEQTTELQSLMRISTAAFSL